MTHIIHTKAGLDIEAKFLKLVHNENKYWVIFYAQDRIWECDQNNNELASHDLLYLL